MTASPITVTPSSTVSECLMIMTARRFRHLPVVEDGNLCGMISIGDLVAAVIASQLFTIEQLEMYIAAGYPA